MSIIFTIYYFFNKIFLKIAPKLILLRRWLTFSINKSWFLSTQLETFLLLECWLNATSEGVFEFFLILHSCHTLMTHLCFAQLARHTSLVPTCENWILWIWKVTHWNYHLTSRLMSSDKLIEHEILTYETYKESW